MRGYEIRVAESKKEIQEAYSLRRMVFVDEQGMFEKDDIDMNDDKAIYINAWSKRNELLVGTVRCYPDPLDHKLWWGGRLAVHHDYRIRGIGVYLILAAIEVVKYQSAKRFLANVMSKNVELFKKIGWEPIGNSFDSFGKPHQLMEVNLDVQDALPLQHTRGKSKL
ncbi:MSMEG_0567/Sll0786 family nitrogen starvation N-acetyltransferase [Neobacillus sp. 179-J 1A1 HS]|uniref:MSMEG_0567/Sll0786 family nitrogen starvation N-acetyltransferase n=1 Tax=Neobacillus driksii TaxID=3035913 RepID=UPI0035BC5A93